MQTLKAGICSLNGVKYGSMIKYKEVEVMFKITSDSVKMVNFVTFVYFKRTVMGFINLYMLISVPFVCY